MERVSRWVLDLSNVAVEPDTDGQRASWSRVQHLCTALEREAAAPVSGVADRSLFYKLSEKDQSKLRAWQRAGRAQLEPWADPVICEMATDDSLCHIVSNDNYRGLRRQFPILQGFQRIWGFRVDSGVTIERRTLAELGGAEISRAEEDEDRTPKRLRSPEGARLLRSEWACRAPSCWWSNFSAIEDLPRNDRGRARCPACDSLLVDVGPAQATKAVKVVASGAVAERIPLPLDARIIAGRGTGPGRLDVRTVASEDAAQRVSRDHLEVMNRNSRVLVRDMASTNGTRIVRRDGRSFDLAPGRMQLLEEGEQAMIADGLWIEVSGRRYPRGSADLPAPALPPPVPTRATKRG